MSGNESGAETPAADNQSTTTIGPPAKKKFHNGWTAELENLMADWADKAACYRWMHEKTSRNMSSIDRSLTFPVIILSTITGTANFALDGFFEPDSIYKKYAQSGIGGLSILAGIITTISSKLAYSTQAEAHRVAGVSWGKFNRLLCIEMNLNPDERMDSLNFLKMFRIELDRLIEQSPPIPENVIVEFNKVFKNASDVIKPEITGILAHTKVFKDTGARLKRLAAEATIALHYKKGVIKQMVEDSLEQKTRNIAIEAARRVAEEMLEKDKAAKAAAAAAASAGSGAGAGASAGAGTGLKKQGVSNPIVERQREERKQELEKIARAKAGTVNAIKERFKTSGVAFQGIPITPVRDLTPLPGFVQSDAPAAAENVVISLLPTEPVEVAQPVVQLTNPATEAQQAEAETQAIPVLDAVEPAVAAEEPEADGEQGTAEAIEETDTPEEHADEEQPREDQEQPRKGWLW